MSKICLECEDKVIRREEKSFVRNATAMRYEKVSENEMNVYVFMEESSEELKFNFKK
jgi:hypothetical protein